MKNLLYILLLTPLFFISSCEEETQSGYDCISNTCTAVFESPQYLTLSDCQSACSDNNGESCVTSLPIYQTTWEVVSGTFTDNVSGESYNHSFPDTYYARPRWTFEDNNTMIESQQYETGGNTQFYSYTYSYFPENCEIHLSQDGYTNGMGEPGNLNLYIYGDLILSILEHTSTNLICEWTDISATQGYNETFRFNLEKVN